MGARIVGILLGLALVGFGYAVLEPQGYVGAYLPPLALGPYESERLVVGATAVGMGVILLIAAIVQKRARKPAPAEAPDAIGGGAPQPRPLW